MNPTTHYTDLGLVNTEEMVQKTLEDKYANPTLLRYTAMGAVQMARGAGSGIPIALHLDPGDSFELAKSCIDSGFSSVMLDGSHHPFDENAELTKRVFDYAHEREVTVAGGLGVLAGIEDQVSHEVSHYTKPEQVGEFSPRIRLNLIPASIPARPAKN